MSRKTFDTRLCENCRNPLKNRHQKKYCSTDCFYKAFKGRPSPKRGRGLIVSQICPTCHESFECSSNSGYRNLGTIYCSNICRAKADFINNLDVLPLSEETVAYIAGLVDGEGSIMLISKKGGCTLRLSISNTFRLVLDWLVKVTGTGAVREVKRGNKDHKICYFFQSDSYAAASLIKLVKPYLRIKQNQAILGLYVQERRQYDSKNKEWQLKALAEMKLMNKRGPEVESTRLNVD